MNWPTVPLGEICHVASGGTPSRTRQDYYDGDVPWVKISDMLQGNVVGTEETITLEGLANSSAKVFPKGTLLLSIFATVGRTAILGIDAATNQAIAGITPDASRIDMKFLRHHLDASVPELVKRSRGVAQVNINLSILKSHPIPLPPLEEQRRIVKILDQADDLRAKRRLAIALLDQLPQAIFLEMFGDPATNPKKWPLVRFGNLASKFSDGPFGSNLKSSHYTGQGIRVWRLQNIGVGELIDDDRAFISEAHFSKLRKHLCEPGDVIIGTLGDPNLRAFVHPPSVAAALNKADCVQVRPRLDVADAAYLCWLCNSKGMEILANSGIQGQTRLRISMGRLREIHVPAPPVELQRLFSARVEAADRAKVSHRSALAELDALFASLRDRAFSKGGR